ncbi:YagK/YfjJ domain-containing protein [Acinetobacter vivianii]|uniref:YagK/YfjJ domain-containing protein n=1 Tax=Acinetobacter vivianii TaxID=1776742 RepID=UPI001905CFD9|nr:inovirus-type Gp2 protein [Acinetobacter vivianii]MBJ8482406.1 inovirus-type Gp2 protein [Acinetobacter vivianii]
MNISIPTLNESKVLVDIENFIISMSYENYTEKGFKVGLMQLIPQFKAIHQNHLQYSQSIKTFDCLSKEVEKMLNGQDISVVNHLNYMQINLLLELLREGKLNISFEAIKIKGQEKDNQESLREYLEQLTRHYAKLLFIRIDLSIELKHQDEVGIEQFNVYLRTFINRVQNQDTCFKDLQGYVWAIEQGATKGYHCHVLLIYDGHKHLKDFGMAIQVGQCWSKITANKGYYFISNSTEYKQKFENKGKLGIGMIHRAQPQQVKNAIEAAMYLVNPEKDNQHLRARIKDMRSFGKGQYKINKRRKVKVE